jgi:hypothetical protein
MRELQSITLPIRELEFAKNKKKGKTEYIDMDSFLCRILQKEFLPQRLKITIKSSSQNSVGEADGIGNLRAEF